MDFDSYKHLENLVSSIHRRNHIQRIALPMNRSIEFVPVTEIVRCLGESAYTTFYLKNGNKLLVSKTLKEYEAVLSQHGFLRVHKSHLVNSNYIRSFVKTSGAHIIMDDGTIVPVSNLKKQEILKRMSN